MKKRLAWLCMLLPWLCAAQAQNGVRVVTEDYPPFNYMADGQVTGLATEVVRAVLERLELSAEIELMEWGSAYDIALNTPNVLIYSIGRSQQREDLFEWVGEITPPDRIYLFALRSRVDRNQIRVGSLEDARGYVIGTTRNDFREQYLISEGFQVGTNLRRSDLVHNNIRHLFWGRVDLIAMSEMPAYTLTRMIGYDPTALVRVLELSGIPPGANYMAFSRGTSPELVSRARAALEQVRGDGTYQRIVEKYRALILTPEEVEELIRK